MVYGLFDEILAVLILIISRTSVSGSLILSFCSSPPSPPFLPSAAPLCLSPPVLSWACLPLGTLYFYSLDYTFDNVWFEVFTDYTFDNVYFEICIIYNIGTEILYFHCFLTTEMFLFSIFDPDPAK